MSPPKNKKKAVKTRKMLANEYSEKKAQVEEENQ